MRLIRTIILIIICLYVGAYIGKEKMNLAATSVIQKAKDIWNTDNTEQEKINNGN